MSIPQQKLREAVLQFLFSLEIGSFSEESMVPFMMKELAISKSNTRKAVERAQKIFAKAEELDCHVRETSLSYEFSRIQSVEKSVLRLAIYEMLIDDEIPQKVAMSEAVRVAKKFGSAEAGKFVNAILDAIYKKSIGKEVEKESLESAAEIFIDAEDRQEIASKQEAEEKKTQQVDIGLDD